MGSIDELICINVNLTSSAMEFLQPLIDDAIKRNEDLLLCLKGPAIYLGQPVEFNVAVEPQVSNRNGRDTASNGKGEGVPVLLFHGVQSGARQSPSLRPEGDRLNGQDLSEGPYADDSGAPDDGPPLDHLDEPVLTSREREVLALLSRGADNQEIAEELGISTNTVKSHIQNIKSKLQTANRTRTALAGRIMLSRD